jgi:hypothetical protein
MFSAPDCIYRRDRAGRLEIVPVVVIVAALIIGPQGNKKG